MKKEKMVEVTVCDFCKQEKETRTCAGCKADACVLCSVVLNVHVTTWREVKDYYTGTMNIGIASQPDYSGTFCKSCSPEDALKTVGFTKRAKAA